MAPDRMSSIAADPKMPQGDSSAEPDRLDIERLVVEHHQGVYGYAFRLTGRQVDAEDLTQQTFLIAKEKLGQVREMSKVRSWLFAVARSCFLKSRRKRVPWPATSVQLDLDRLPERLPPREDIDTERLQTALDELPAEFRLVLVMFYFEDCSYKEIAAKLDVPIGTVMSRLSRAKRHLRGRLLEAGFCPDPTPTDHPRPAGRSPRQE